MNNSINTYIATVINMNIYGIIPMNPVNELLIIAGRSFAWSLIAVGEKSMNTPILQINRSRINGIILSIIDGTLMKYFWSSFGPQA